jgi:valyl-tRNA synthetase
MPPPNVTARLHMGHGTGYTIQDFLIRWKRMKGFNVCWLPGTDHAGIATQMMVEKQLAAEGLTKQDLGREKFVKRVEAWREQYGGQILSQFEQMGFSCNWDRLVYSLDSQLSQAVRSVFVQLFQEGLIYRGERLVNWDCQLQTAISDDEVETKEIQGFLFVYHYRLVNTSESLLVATTRPETLFGDQALAVHPSDERYQKFIGSHVKCPLEDRIIPVVADSYVKPEFGTGVVKISPSHDLNDFEIALRHGLSHRSILTAEGTLTKEVPEEFQGLDRFEARKKVVSALKEKKLFHEQIPYKHLVPHSERSKTIVEYRLSWQWYVRMKDLAQPALEAAEKGEISFYPENWKKTWDHWLSHIQDWCISRQLWWGHRVPVWTCSDCGHVEAFLEDPSSCSNCHSHNLQQDPDVLDTWFSSWLWPFSSFGWPSDQASKDLSVFFPSDVLVTGPDIIFLWVARMTMASLKFKKQLPFKDIYFNATVCDEKGRKFSKTLGNGIDPEDMMKRYGADAVRYTALHLAPLGGRIKMKTSDFELGFKFLTKLWNANRFLSSYLSETLNLKPLNELELSLPQIWIVMELHRVSGEVDALLEQYRLNESVEKLYHYFWSSFCDWFLEASKPSLLENNEQKQTSLSVLVYAFEGVLRLLHPVIPFLTEELWQKLPVHPDWPRAKTLAQSSFPSTRDSLRNESAYSTWMMLKNIVSEIRSFQQQSGLSADVNLDVFLEINEKFLHPLRKNENLIKQLARLSSLTIEVKIDPPQQSLITVGKGFKIYIPVAHLVDLSKERQRLEKESNRLEKILFGLRKKLSQQSFLQKAPSDIIETTRQQEKNLSEQKRNIDLSLQSLSK